MRKIHILFFSLLMGISSFFSAQESNIVPGNLLIMLSSDADAHQLTKDLYFLGGIKTNLKVERVLSKSMHIYLFDFNDTVINQERILSAVKKNHLVKIAQFNHIFQERAIPNDTQFGVMWDLNNIGQSGGTANADIDAPEAWNITTGGLTSEGDTIVVAVIDGGFDLTHVDLNFRKNYQEIPNNGIDDDSNGYVDDYDGWNGYTADDNLTVASHGTHVSGIVGAKGNNGIGVTGVNWNVKIMPISYGSSGSGIFEANTVAAYSYVRDQRKLYNQSNGTKGAFIVATNSSFGVDLGQPSSYPLWCAMYDSLGTVGILSAGATANQNYNVDVQGDIPTACTSNWLITVTNTTRTDTKYIAGYGSTTIDLGAPGTSITSTTLGNTYGLMTGTSMATPHVAGAIALMYSVACPQFIANYKANPSAMALVIKDSLLKAVDIIPALNEGLTVSGGRLNLYKSVNAIQNYCNCYAYSNPHLTFDAGITIKQPIVSYSNNNSFTSTEITLYNYGTDTLKSCTINYKIDATTLQTYNWVGNLPTCQFTNITLNTNNQIDTGLHVLTVYISNPNGNTDGYSFNDTATRNFNVFHIYAGNFKSSFNIYPIPNNGKFTITSNLEQTQNVTIKLMDVLGRIIFSTLLENVSIGSYDIDINAPSSGMYLVEIAGTNDKTIKKINIIK